MKECSYYSKNEDGSVTCHVCPHECRIGEGKTGRCRSRQNQDGRLYSLVYGRPCAVADDPIEKKPLARWHPGTRCLSIACTGCNLSCPNCQNYTISQARPDDAESYDLPPEAVVSLALRHRLPTIAYTYTEPLTYIEYVTDTASLAHERGLYNVLVSAGYVNEQPLRDLARYLDAANIDLKSFSADIYRRFNGAGLEPVLRTLQILRDAGVHVEITNLLIPGVNDDPGMFREMCRWLVSNEFGDCVLHISRFFPTYKMDEASPTPKSDMREARQIAVDEGMQYVYLGNV